MGGLELALGLVAAAVALLAGGTLALVALAGRLAAAEMAENEAEPHSDYDGLPEGRPHRLRSGQAASLRSMREAGL